MSSPESKIKVGIFAIFSELFRLSGLLSGYSGNFLPLFPFFPVAKSINGSPERAFFFTGYSLPEKPLSMQVSKWTQITDLRPFYDSMHKA